MALRQLTLLLITLALCGSLHARWFQRRDDLTGFPEVPPPADNDVSSYPDDDAGQYPEEQVEQTPDSQGPAPSTDDDDRLSNELKEYHCNPIESLFEELVNSTGIDSLLKALEAGGTSTKFVSSDHIFNMMKANTGYDLREHDDRHRLACQLQGIKSINDLAAFTGLPAELLDLYYTQTMDEFKSMGGMSMIRTLVTVTVDFNEWVAETGYPTMPLKKPVDMDDVMDRMKRWQTAIMSIELKGNAMIHMLDSMNSGISPLRFLPQYTARVLKSSVTTDEVLDRLCIDKVVYEKVKPLLKDDVIEGMNEFIIIAYRIIEEFNKMGLFDLKLEA